MGSVFSSIFRTAQFKHVDVKFDGRSVRIPFASTDFDSQKNVKVDTLRKRLAASLSVPPGELEIAVLPGQQILEDGKFLQSYGITPKSEIVCSRVKKNLSPKDQINQIMADMDSSFGPRIEKYLHSTPDQLEEKAGEEHHILSELILAKNLALDEVLVETPEERKCRKEAIAKVQKLHKEIDLKHESNNAARQSIKEASKEKYEAEQRIRESRKEQAKESKEQAEFENDQAKAKILEVEAERAKKDSERVRKLAEEEAQRVADEEAKLEAERQARAQADKEAEDKKIAELKAADEFEAKKAEEIKQKESEKAAVEAPKLEEPEAPSAESATTEAPSAEAPSAEAPESTPESTDSTDPSDSQNKQPLSNSAKKRAKEQKKKKKGSRR